MQCWWMTREAIFTICHASVRKRTPCWPRPSDLLPYWVTELLGVWTLFKTLQANETAAACHGPQPNKGPSPLLPTGWRVPKEGTPGRVTWTEAGAELTRNCPGQSYASATATWGVFTAAVSSDWDASASQENPTLGGRKYWSRFGGEIDYRK